MLSALPTRREMRSISGSFCMSDGSRSAMSARCHRTGAPMALEQLQLFEEGDLAVIDLLGGEALLRPVGPALLRELAELAALLRRPGDDLDAGSLRLLCRIHVLHGDTLDHVARKIAHRHL